MAPASETPAGPARPAWRRFLPLLGFALLAWVLSQLDLSALGKAFARLEPWALLQGSLLFTANLLLKAFRWQRMLHAQQLALPARVAIPAFFSSVFYGQVTFGRVGELYRAEALIERGVPIGTALSSSVYDRLLDLVTVLLVACVFGAFVIGDARAAALAGAGMLLCLGAALAALYARKLAAFAPIARLRAFVAGKRGTRGLLGMVGQLIDGLGPLLRPGFLIEALLWTAVSWFAYFAALWVLAAGMDVVATRTLLTAGAALGALSALLPVTVSGLGAREVILMHALALEHVPGERAVALSLVHLSVMSASAIAFGLVGLLVRHTQHGPAQPAAKVGSVEQPPGS